MTQRSNYFDTQAVEIRFVPEPADERPDEVWFANPPPPSGVQQPLERHVVEQALLHHVVDGYAKAAGSPPPYILEANYVDFNWGADSNSCNIVLLMASSVAGPLAQSLWSGFRAWLGERADGPAFDMSDENAEWHARWRVEASFDVSADELELIDEQRIPAEQAWSFCFRAPSDERFEIDIVNAGIGLVTGRIRRQAAQADN